MLCGGCASRANVAIALVPEDGKDRDAQYPRVTLKMAAWVVILILLASTSQAADLLAPDASGTSTNRVIVDELVMDNVGTMLDKGLVAPLVGIHMGGARRMVEFNRTSTALGTRSLSGRLVDNPDSMVVVSAKGDALSGVIWDGATRYEIGKAADGHVEVRQVDPVPIVGRDAIAKPLSSFPRPQQTRDNGDDIDIFVYWTRSTRLGASVPDPIPGLTLDEISTRVVNLVEYTNRAFSDSGSELELNLVGSSEYDSGMITDLEPALANFTQSSQVVQVRSLHAADLMALVGSDASDTWSGTGRGYVGGGVTGDWVGVPSPTYGTRVSLPMRSATISALGTIGINAP